MGESGSPVRELSFLEVSLQQEPVFANIYCMPTVCQALPGTQGTEMSKTSLPSKLTVLWQGRERDITI